MTPLFVLAALLLMASGALKLRAAARAELGVHLPSVVELVVAILLPVLAMGGPTAETGMAALAGALAVLVASSLHLMARIRHRNRLRDRTEGRRLETYVRYLSDQEDGAS